MPASLPSLINEVNTLLSVLPYAGNADLYKIAYLQTKDDKTFPIVRRGQSEAYQISPRDVRAMVFYHRVISEADEPTDQGKGSDVVNYTTYNMRLVGVGSRRLLSALNDEDNADLARTVKLLLNGKTLSDKSKVWPVSVNSDKISIFEEEWAGYDFKNLSLEITAFSIDYNIKQRVVCG